LKSKEKDEGGRMKDKKDEREKRKKVFFLFINAF